MSSDAVSAVVFQSTSSVWRTTTADTGDVISGKFQSTSSVWRTTQSALDEVQQAQISIHVLRVEDDCQDYI